MNLAWNVDIRHYKGGAPAETRRVHNSTTLNGKQWLSRLVCYSYIDPSPFSDVPEDVDRIRYLGLGMGSISASAGSLTTPYTLQYPAGYDPNGTTGNKYKTSHPTGPLISTLERPIRLSGGENPYDTADPGDVWLLNNLDVYRQNSQSVTFKADIDATGGDWLYGTLLAAGSTYISEAALLTDAADPNTPYNPVVAYVHFDPITLTSTSLVALTWSVRFRS